MLSTILGAIAIVQLIMAVHSADPAQLFDITANVGVIHMRKSGGTSINNVLNKWMLLMNCSDKDYDAIYLDVKSGLVYSQDKRKNMTKCSNLNIIESEFNCCNSQFMLKHFVPAYKRKSNFKLLTTFRHPISRIVSQAFYGGFADKLLRRNIHDYCAAQNMTDFVQYHIATCMSNPNANCDCIVHAYQDTLNTIKSNNNTLWFEWMKSNKGFNDDYNTNYFIKRLYVNADVKRVYVGPLNGVESAIVSDICKDYNDSSTTNNNILVKNIPSWKSNISSVAANLYSYNNYALIAFLYMDKCNYWNNDWGLTHAKYMHILNVVKQFIYHHVDYLLVEQLATNRSVTILQKVLGGPKLELSDFTDNTNPSVYSRIEALICKYRDKYQIIRIAMNLCNKRGGTTNTAANGSTNDLAKNNQIHVYRSDTIYSFHSDNDRPSTNNTTTTGGTKLHHHINMYNEVQRYMSLAVYNKLLTENTYDMLLYTYVVELFEYRWNSNYYDNRVIS